jgi:hypothetical protein
MKRGLFIADSHTGGAFGLFPPNFGPNPKPLNPIQEYIWRCWLHMDAQLPPLDFIVFMAEQNEGSNAKEDAAMISETNRSRQVDAAIEAALLPLAHLGHGCPVHVLTGSQYHVGKQADNSHEFGSKLHFAGYNVSQDAFGHYAHTWLHLDREGVRFDIAHLQSGAINRSMPLEREMRNMLERCAEEKDDPDDVIVRAHTHSDVILSIGHRWALTCPAWKCQDGYAAGSRTPNRWKNARIGSVLIEVDGEAKRKGGDPVTRIVKYYYRTPPVERVYYEQSA